MRFETILLSHFNLDLTRISPWSLVQIQLLDVCSMGLKIALKSDIL